MQTQVSPALSNMQYELMRLYSTNVSDEDLLNIRRLIAKYFWKKTIAEADRIWDEKGYTNELMNEWLNEGNEILVK
jgi:hypothetical protein